LAASAAAFSSLASAAASLALAAFDASTYSLVILVDGASGAGIP